MMSYGGESKIGNRSPRYVRLPIFCLPTFHFTVHLVLTEPSGRFFHLCVLTATPPSPTAVIESVGPV